MIASLLFALLFAALQGTNGRKWNNTGKGSIAFEEAWTTPAMIQLTGAGGGSSTIQTNLLDIHNQRLRAMDAAGVDFVVLSCANPCTQGIADQATAEAAARTFNDDLAAAISNNTLRFGGFATLAMHDPSVAAQELRRAVVELRFLGALLNDYQISGPNNDTLLFYDQPAYDIFWETVTELDVPVYLHPRTNIKEIQTLLYGHASWLAGASQGFAATLSTHILGICGNGVFDRFPSLQILVGHLGERIPSDLWRIDNALAGVIGGSTTFPPMNQTIAHYLRHNILETTSGNFATSLLKYHAAQIGFDRILYSVDYPFVAFELGEAWLQELEGALHPRDLLALKRGRAIEVLHLER
ncbi:amidohydrolase 2 [Mycena amicta]|nr:amidohydrolase 2 [Mycena amicta]